MDCDGHGMGYTVSRKRRRMSRFPVMQIMDLIMDPPLLLHGNSLRMWQNGLHVTPLTL